MDQISQQNRTILPRQPDMQNAVQQTSQQLDRFSGQAATPNWGGSSNNLANLIRNIIMAIMNQLNGNPSPSPSPVLPQPVYGAVIPNPPVLPQPVYGAVIPNPPVEVQPVYGAVIPNPPIEVQPVYGAVIPNPPIEVQPVYGAFIPNTEATSTDDDISVPPNLRG